MAIIWAIINILFLVAIFYFAKKIRDKHSPISGLLFVIFILAIFSGNKKREIIKNNEKTENQVAKLGYFQTEIKDANPKIVLIGSIYNIKNNKNFEVKGNSYIHGLVLGFNWNHISLDITKSNNQKDWNYKLIGVLDYRILGTTIYSVKKIYTSKLKFEKDDFLASD